jgi:uncharacterized protein with ATP-grasp and redox domains
MCEFFNRKLPEPLRGKETGTWAHETITRRLPEIANRIKKENNYSSLIEEKIDQLIQEIPNGRIRMIEDHHAPDYDAWVSYVSVLLGKSWLQIPWFFAEFYFYRRILEAVGYFDADGPSQVDPYLYQKEQGITSAQKSIAQLCENLAAWKSHGFDRYGLLADLLEIDLWGNRADLSLWPAQDKEHEQRTSIRDQSERILVNDMVDALKYFQQNDHDQRLDFILDNAGFEMVCDLQLAAYILDEDLAKSVVLHVKPYPIFVSDAMEKDVRYTIQRLIKMEHKNVSALGKNLDRYLQVGRLEMRSDSFWGSPLAMWEMPSGIKKEFSQSRLILMKGDANYRRVLGDRHWDFTEAMQDIACYLPACVLALRVCKSEVAVGLTREIIQQTSRKDKAWLVDGNWGMIQFVAKAQS